jgi:hypothetical protein
MSAALSRAELNEFKDEVRRLIAAEDAARLLLEANVKRMDKDLASVIQTVSGVPGLSDDVKDLKRIASDLSGVPKAIDDLKTAMKDFKDWKEGLPPTPREIVRARYRAWGMVAAVVVAIAGVVFGVIGVVQASKATAALESRTTTTTTVTTPAPKSP